MSLVVLLKGVNVGGHRTIRPSLLAKELIDLDVVNVGAAGTLVVRNQVSREALRAEIVRRLPFQVDVMICSGKAILRLASSDVFASHVARPDVVQFVGVMARRRPPPTTLPLSLPSKGDWGLQVLGYQDRFVLGLHRREMKAIRYLGQLEKVFGTPMTIRTWNTMQKIVRILRTED